jgi:hypothetical protein
MSMNVRLRKSINMKKLKRSIDKRIKGILGYLENNNIDLVNESLTVC